MVSHPGFTRAGKTYLWSVIAAGFAAVAGSIYHLYVEPIGNQWFILAALTLISGSATVKLPFSYASISISETFVFTAVLLYGPEAGTVIFAVYSPGLFFLFFKRHVETYPAVFYIFAPAVITLC